ncbi:Interstitial collagenase [Liparis tanakae]|uniref:Interstitial collagenase n=1 Tax=Liparis tanakae TaxID=230148 RepID=A0A4Z2E1K8_9TELE|nr:Interstitial collagenase [Liparis tanakae]
MKAPRCGVSDISRYGHFDGKPRWEKRQLTYRITQYTKDLTQSQVDAVIAEAFQLYSDVIPLDFRQINSGTADIMILFKGGCESGSNKIFINDLLKPFLRMELQTCDVRLKMTWSSSCYCRSRGLLPF